MEKKMNKVVDGDDKMKRQSELLKRRFASFV